MSSEASAMILIQQRFHSNPIYINSRQKKSYISLIVLFIRNPPFYFVLSCILAAYIFLDWNVCRTGWVRVYTAISDRGSPPFCKRNWKLNLNTSLLFFFFFSSLNPSLSMKFWNERENFKENIAGCQLGGGINIVFLFLFFNSEKKYFKRDYSSRFLLKKLCVCVCYYIKINVQNKRNIIVVAGCGDMGCGVYINKYIAVVGKKWTYLWIYHKKNFFLLTSSSVCVCMCNSYLIIMSSNNFIIYTSNSTLFSFEIRPVLCVCVCFVFVYKSSQPTLPFKPSQKKW